MGGQIHRIVAAVGSADGPVEHQAQRHTEPRSPMSSGNLEDVTTVKDDEFVPLKQEELAFNGTSSEHEKPPPGYASPEMQETRKIDDGEGKDLLSTVDPVFFWIVMVNMLVKGFQDTLPALATLYFFKDDLGVGPVGATSSIAIVSLPWTLKPIYGFVSDNYPIMGMRRKPYIIISMAFMSFNWAMMALAVNGKYGAIFCLLGANLGCAVANVCCEAITVELSSNLSYQQAATLQSFMWGACAVGAFTGSAFGGFVLEVIGKRWMFGIMAIIPAISATTALFGPPEVPMTEDAKAAVVSFGTFAKTIMAVLLEEHVWRSCVFLFIFFAVPSTSAAAYFYFTNHLHMGESVMAVVMTVSMGTWLVGVIFYENFLRKTSVRKILGCGTILASTVALLAILLYTGANQTLGIPDEAFVICDTSMVTAVKTVAQLPLMTMMAILCPKGAEATLYSTFTGIMNLGQVTGGEAGALLSLVFGITSHKFDKMWAVCLCAGSVQMIPIFFLWLLPDRKTLDRCEQNNRDRQCLERAEKNKLQL